MKLFLVGMPGSGKSKLGEELADALGIPFYDLDEGIEHEAGLTIPEIFEQKGEKHFRMLESKLLRRFPGLTGHFVLSTGGGTPCFFDNMGFMNQEGRTIFLDVSIEELSRRLIEIGIESRPILKGKTPEELLNFLDQQLKERKNYYQNAMLTLSGDQITATELLTEIKKQGW